MFALPTTTKKATWGVRSWGSTQEENRNTVSDEGSQGLRRKCEQYTRTKRLHCGWGAFLHQDWLSIFTRRMSVLLLSSPRSPTPASRLSQDLQTRN